MNELQRSIRKDVDECVRSLDNSIRNAQRAIFETPIRQDLIDIVKDSGIDLDSENQSLEFIKRFADAYEEHRDIAISYFDDSARSSRIDGYSPDMDEDFFSEEARKRLSREPDFDLAQSRMTDASDQIVTLMQSIEADDGLFDDGVWSAVETGLNNAIELTQSTINSIYAVCVENQKLEDVIDDFVQAGK